MKPYGKQDSYSPQKTTAFYQATSNLNMQTLPNTSIGSSSELKLFSFPFLIIHVYSDVHYITLYF